MFPWNKELDLSAISGPQDSSVNLMQGRQQSIQDIICHLKCLQRTQQILFTITKRRLTSVNNKNLFTKILYSYLKFST